MNQIIRLCCINDRTVVENFSGKYFTPPDHRSGYDYRNDIQYIFLNDSESVSSWMPNAYSDDNSYTMYQVREGGYLYYHTVEDYINDRAVPVNEITPTLFLSENNFQQRGRHDY